MVVCDRTITARLFTKFMQSMDQYKESSLGALLLRKIEQQAIVQCLIERVAVSLCSQERSFEEVS